MTLPDERYWAIRNTQQFLLRLLDPKETPRVPRYLRQQAGSLLKHYPNDWHLERLAEKSPDVIINRMEPLTRMIMQHEQEKQNDDAP